MVWCGVGVVRVWYGCGVVWHGCGMGVGVGVVWCGMGVVSPLEQSPRIPRSTTIFDIIFKRLAMLCKYAMHMRTYQSNHFRAR